MGGCRVSAVYFGTGSVSAGKRDARRAPRAGASPGVGATTGGLEQRSCGLKDCGILDRYKTHIHTGEPGDAFKGSTLAEGRDFRYATKVCCAPDRERAHWFVEQVGNKHEHEFN